MKTLIKVTFALGVPALAAAVLLSVGEDADRSFDDGLHRVVESVVPGIYRTEAPSPGCSWARLSGQKLGPDTIIANGRAASSVIVEITPLDEYFMSNRCNEWRLATPRGPIGTSFGDGSYFVGAELTPGPYRTIGGKECRWFRLRNFLWGRDGSIIATGIPDQLTVVETRPDDYGFHPERCGTWTTALS